MNRYKHTSYFVKQIVSVLCGDYWGYGEPEGWNGIEFIFVEKIKDYKYSCVCDVKNCVSESSGRESPLDERLKEGKHIVCKTFNFLFL